MIFPNKTSYAANQPFVFFDDYTLTSSYVAGNVASFDEHNMVGLEITYAKGSETTFNLMIESSIDGGTTYAQQVAIAATGGTTAVTKNEYAFTAASYAASDKITLIITPIKGDHFKVWAKYAGGSAPGTVSIRGMFGWV